MRALSISIIICQVAGLWTTSAFQALWTRLLHKLYISIVTLMVFISLITGFINLVLHCRSISEFANNGFRVLPPLLDFSKALNLIVHRKTITHILVTLETDPCTPRDSREIIIQNEHNRRFKNIAIQWAALTIFTILVMLMQTIIHDIPMRKLPRKAWLPYDATSGGLYWFTYILQAATLAYMYMIPFGYDSLICGMFLEISTKLTILQYRLANLRETFEKRVLNHDNPDEDIEKIERNLITDCVSYHQCLLNMAKRVNSIFSIVLFMQYVVSALCICLSVYTISVMKLKLTEYIYIAFYLSFVIIQIFFYCACANEVTIQSGNIAGAVFTMDWIHFSQATCKSMIIIGCQTQCPIIFTTGYFVTLSLDSFKNIIKIAYSIYNAMQSLN